MEKQYLPTHVSIALFSGFQILDAFGPLEIINNLAEIFPITLSVIAASREPVSSLPPASHSAAAHIGQSRLGSRSGQAIVPTHTFAEPPEKIDLLIVPGGVGTRYDDLSGPVVEFVRDVFPRLRFLLTVCTGAVLAGRAGVLDGGRATSNKIAWHLVEGLGNGVEWVRKARWIVDERETDHGVGKVWTSSGISAGIDSTFAWVEKIYGKETADDIARKMEYLRNETWDDDPFC